MKEIVLNDCYGGFGLSNEAVMRYAELKGITLYPCIEEFNDEELLKKSSLSLILYSTEPVANEKELSDANLFKEDCIPRDDPCLVQVVKELGDKANTAFSKLKVIEIPDDVAEWEIEEYDGIEWVAEKHRTWGWGI